MPRSFRFVGASFAALLLAAHTLVAQQATQPAAPQSTSAPAQPTFEEFLVGLRAEALTKGISQATIDLALTNVEHIPVVTERDKSQPENVITLDEYVKKRLTPKVIRTAQEMATTHADLLKQVADSYGVPPSILIAVWGVESNFGTFTGTRPIIGALATLAYDGRRVLFRNELFKALEIIDKGHITLEQLTGSWAGAMGQPQFMPSSYLKYAVDFDQDGKADIWTSTADVFGSIGHYLKEYGWTTGGSWGREVKISKAAMTKIKAAVPQRATGCKAERELTEFKPISTWTKLGVTLPSGKALPKADPEAALVRGAKRHFLVFKNYNALLGYNCANSYAVSLGLIADAVTK